MSLDQRGRAAAADLLDHTRPDTAAGLRDLHRLRRRRTVERSATLVAALLAVVAVLSWSTVRGDRRGSEPIDHGPRVRNGILLVADRGAVARVGVATRGTPDPRPSDLADYSMIAFTRDGSELVYQNRSGQVAAISVFHGSTRVLSDCPRDQLCDFGLSPDGETLAFHHRKGLELRHLATGTATVLPVGGGAGWPRWSPDGRQIAFAHRDGLQVVRADGTGRRTLYSVTTHRHVVPLASWSPDGQRLAFIRMDDVLDGKGRIQESEFTLMTVRSDGTDLRELQSLGRCSCLGIPGPAATWSPDGRWIAFTRVDAGILDIYGDSTPDGTYLVRPDGTGLRSAGGPGAQLAWQPRIVPTGTS